MSEAYQSEAFQPQTQLETYQGQFGEFTITQRDRQGVIIYRTALMVAAVCFAIATGLVLFWPSPIVYKLITWLFFGFSAALGVSLFMIHIYMVQLHRTLQAFWLIGTVAGLYLTITQPTPLAITVYNQPSTIWGIGFIFAALTGIYFKEAFCFNRLETKVLTFTIPILLLGHLFAFLPLSWERGLLSVTAGFFLVFALRKVVQRIPDDIGDKSVFAYLKSQRAATS